MPASHHNMISEGVLRCVMIVLVAALAICPPSAVLARNLHHLPQHIDVALPQSRSVLQVVVNDTPMGNITLPRIAFITTGGTIASIQGPHGTLIPATDGDSLLASVPGLDSFINVSGIYAAAKIDSSTATPSFWMAVANLTLQQLALEEVDGVVILHGTDTLEQTAWFLQCILGIGNQDKPVVLTGAMNGADSGFADGPGNILSASVVASSPQASGLGVLVAFAQQVYSSRFVTKVSANSNAAFGSVNGGGIIGNVVNGRFVQYFELKGAIICGINGGFPMPSTALPLIGLQPAYPGASADLMAFYYITDHVGLVIEGLGSGNIGLGLASGVSTLLATAPSFQVVVARKPNSGVTAPDYGCQGCLDNLVLQGVVEALNLDAFQARIVMMLAMAANTSSTDLQDIYTSISFPY